MNSFGPERKIKRERDFQRIFSAGKDVSNKFFVCKYCLNDLGWSRVGIIASRKFGKAHIRNKFKRYVRECFRTQDFKKGIDLLIIPKKELRENFSSISFDMFRFSFLAVIDKAKGEIEDEI